MSLVSSTPKIIQNLAPPTPTALMEIVPKSIHTPTPVDLFQLAFETLFCFAFLTTQSSHFEVFLFITPPPPFHVALVITF